MEVLIFLEIFFWSNFSWKFYFFGQFLEVLIWAFLPLGFVTGSNPSCAEIFFGIVNTPPIFAIHLTFFNS